MTVDISSQPVALLGAGVVLSGAVLYSLTRRKSTQPLPPGPPRTLLLGNALDMPREREWLKFSEWAFKYGDVVYLNVVGQPIVLLSSARATNELLIKRGASYSDRPHFSMAGDLVGWGPLLGLLPYDDRLRKTRKLTTRLMSARASEQYLAMQEEIAQALVKRLLRTPEEFNEHIRWSAGSFILKVAYGYDVQEEADPWVATSEAAMNNFSLATATPWAVDVVPQLRYLPEWFPGAGFLRQAQTWRKETFAMVKNPMEYVKSHMHDGTAKASWASMLLQGEDGQGVDPEEEDVITWALGSMYAGGADTTVSSVWSFFLAMTLHPEVHDRAQREIDALTKGERLPTYSDRSSLPFLDAVVQELHRWNPVAPLALPHRCTEDNEFDGYFIPKGTMIIPNIWHILHDPAQYADPMEFRPERFLGSNPEEDPKKYAFGFGRRECPGRFIADASVWLDVALTLATFNVSKAKDENGVEITPVVQYQTGTISHPTPFKCRIEPRSEKAKELIKSSG